MHYPLAPVQLDAALPVPTQRRAPAETAAGYARRRHQGQQRPDGSAFIEHPLEVARLLTSAGAGQELVTAGLLHDVLEKTPATEVELRALFGPRITDLVVAVTDDETIPDWRRRKAACRDRLRLGADQEALLLFAADKISRIRELRRGPEPPAPPTVRDRLAHYHASLHMLERELPDEPLVVLLRQEIEAYAPASAAAIALSRSR